MNSEKLLQAENLSKRFGTGEAATVAVNNVSLSIFKGELLVILGHSGSGKSTLLNLIGGMDTPDSGTITVDGQTITGFSDRKLTEYRKNKVGFVFQSFNLIQELTAIENVSITAENKEKAIEMLKLVGLEQKADRYPSQLSGGEQQRVSIARALAKKSEFLICDEPTGALDFETGKQILKILEDLVRIYGKTVVIVTHTAEIEKMANRVLHMKNGSIIEETINEHPVSSDTIEW